MYLISVRKIYHILLIAKRKKNYIIDQILKTTCDRKLNEASCPQCRLHRKKRLNGYHHFIDKRRKQDSNIKV